MDEDAVDWGDILSDTTGSAGDDGLGMSGSGPGGGGSGSGIGPTFGSIGSIGSGGGGSAAGFDGAQYLSDDCYSRASGDTASDEGYTCITLLYGTNRAPLNDFGATLDEQEAYSVRPDPKCEPGLVEAGERYCHLGLMTITVPDNRQRGDRINAVPRDAREVSDRQRRRLFSVWDYEELNADAFADLATQMLDDAVGEMNGEYDNQAIIFIHGFNVRFRDAAFRAAQMKYDLDFPGPVLFYSWPANGSIMHYLSDMDDADLSVDGLVDFLRLARRSLPDAELNIVAHSMGTRVFAQALNRLAVVDPEFEMNHVFFASGDLDRNLFVEWVQPAAPMMNSLTLYTSGSDVAVASSQLLRNLFPARGEDLDRKSRIGFYPENAHPPVFGFGVGPAGLQPQTIDMTRSHFSFLGFATRYLLRRARLGHSDYMERTPIIEDMSCILRFGASAPDTRHTGMSPTTDTQDAVYWHFTDRGEPSPQCPPTRESDSP